MRKHDSPARIARLVHPTKRAFLVAISTLVIGGTTPAVIAGPAVQPAGTAFLAQNVGWLTTEQAASLDVGIDVLVPSWVPAPFDGVAPSISAASGYYEFYWIVPGGPPTFLQITGIAGGALPAGSPADLNKQLAINASVQGWPAIHDIGIPAGTETPIYDQVWWIANGVLYSVSSNNMTGTDSLSLANSLVSLQVPAAEPPPAEPPAPEEPVWEEPTAPPSDASTDSGPVWEEPPAAADEGAPDVGGATEAVTDQGGDAQEQVAVPETAEESVVPEQSTANEAESAPATGSLPSDGTDGPRPPVFGGDGTGGVQDLALPRERNP